MALTETWLDKSVPDTHACLDGFRIIGADKTDATGKVQDGRVFMYINSRWCTTSWFTRGSVIQTLSARAFNFPRECSTAVLSNSNSDQYYVNRGRLWSAGMHRAIFLNSDLTKPAYKRED